MFAGHPGFHNFRSPPSFQLFLELSLLVNSFLYFLMSVLDVSVFILYSFNIAYFNFYVNPFVFSSSV